MVPTLTSAASQALMLCSADVTMPSRQMLLLGSCCRMLRMLEGSWMLMLGSMSKADMMERPSNRSGWLQTCKEAGSVAQPSLLLAINALLFCNNVTQGCNYTLGRLCYGRCLQGHAAPRIMREVHCLKQM